jgi:hypothetical protein
MKESNVPDSLTGEQEPIVFVCVIFGWILHITNTVYVI